MHTDCALFLRLLHAVAMHGTNKNVGSTLASKDLNERFRVEIVSAASVVYRW